MSLESNNLIELQVTRGLSTCENVITDKIKQE